MRIDWERAGVNIYHNERPIPLPEVGSVSLWTSSDLDTINHDQHYHVRILGRVLDQIYDILMDAELTLGDIGGGKYIQN